MEWHEEGAVNWIGYHKDVKGLYEESHVAVLPSYREGLPKALVEAMAIGRPVVTTDVPGCRTVVKDGITGYKVEVRNAEELREAMDKLITDKSLRIKMGKAGRQFAEEEFSLRNVLDRTFEIL